MPNTVVNLGGCGICLNSAPGALIEGHKIINDAANGHTALQIRGPEPGQIDHPGGGEIVRNNLACFNDPAGQSFSSIGTVGATQSGNVTRIGAEARSGVCAR